MPYSTEYIKSIPEALSEFDPVSLISVSSQAQFTELAKFGIIAGVLMILIHIVVFNLLIFRRVSSGTMATRFTAVDIVLYGPILEELVFRLGGMTAVYYFTGSIPLAIIFTALAFGLYHLVCYGPYKVISTFIQGIFLGIIFLMGGFVACVVAHMTNNFLALMGV